MCKDVPYLSQCCGPTEDPNNEVRTEVPSYNGVTIGNSQIPLSGSPAPYNNSYNQGSFAPQTGGDDFGAVPMPPPSMPPGGGGGGYGGGAGLTEDAILSDLASSEEKAYQDAFNAFNGGQPVPLDNAAMRSFIDTNASCDDVEIALLQAMDDTMTVQFYTFLELLRNNSMADTEIIGAFTQLSSDGVQLSAEETRNGLVMLSSSMMQRNFTDNRWDAILNMVMMDAGPTVDMEQWMRYAKTVARFIRLFQFCGL